MTAASAVRTGVIRVFLLDDTRELRLRVRGALSEDADMKVVGEADDPVDGLPLIEDLQPDVVVCDLSMPRMDGLEAIPRIAACAPGAGIVIFSGFLSDALGNTALQLGADSYVEKSQPLTELAETVHAVARARRSGARPAPPPQPAAGPIARPAPAAAPAAREERPLEQVVAEVSALGVRRLSLLTAACFAIATVATRVAEIVPSTFLVLWLLPVLAMGALTPPLAAATAVVTGAGLYTWCVYEAGAATWYGAGLGVSLCMVTLAVVGDRMTNWMRRRVRAHEALLQELQRSNTELEHFAYVASHDLAAPLRTVSSFTTMLQRRYEGQLDDEADKMIGFITSGTRRMQQMIEDLLAFARAGRVETNTEPIELGTVLDGVLADLAGQIHERSATVEAGPLPRLVADEARMAQVLLNLVSNAIKFCPDERSPVVEVSAARIATGWRIDVRDNGIGIDPRFATKAFGMFQRLHADEEFPGTGIGLAICQRIVERHGGRIWVDGFEGEGSTFSFTIPDQ